MNILLRLMAEMAMRQNGLPPAEPVRFSSRALEWFSERIPAVGASGLLALYIDSALPQPLKIPCVVEGERSQDGVRAAQLRFVGLSDAVVDMLEKLIFRHHRRLVAGAKHSAN